MRLTGLHETASMDKFNYGVADRGASVRVPHSFVNNGYKGYLEDRRPNSQGDPYQIASQILKTISEVSTSESGRRLRLKTPPRPRAQTPFRLRPLREWVWRRTSVPLRSMSRARCLAVLPRFILPVLFVPL